MRQHSTDDEGSWSARICRICSQEFPTCDLYADSVFSLRICILMRHISLHCNCGFRALHLYSFRTTSNFCAVVLEKNRTRMYFSIHNTSLISNSRLPYSIELILRFGVYYHLIIHTNNLTCCLFARVLSFFNHWDCPIRPWDHMKRNLIVSPSIKGAFSWGEGMGKAEWMKTKKKKKKKFNKVFVHVPRKRDSCTHFWASSISPLRLLHFTLYNTSNAIPASVCIHF